MTATGCREIARLDVDENNDTKGNKNSAELLKRLSELCTTALYQNISVLILQLDSEVWEACMAHMPPPMAICVQ
jgi:hypothetical protein